jgi:uncharacterized protein (TIGR02678 family)
MSNQANQPDVFSDLSHVDAAQARQCARVLLRRPVVRPDGPDGHLLHLMYRHRHILQELFSSYLGYPLLVERRFARLYKRLDGQPGRGISGFTPRTYVYLTLTLAALVEVGRQVLLSQLVADVRGAAAEARIMVSEELVEMRALSGALRHLVDLGVLEETEGTVASVGYGRSGEALITVNLELLGLVMARTELTRPPEQDNPSQEGLAVSLDDGVLGRRRLIEDTVVLYCDLPAREAEYMRTHQRQEGFWLDRYFGLQTEARSEGIAAVDPEGYLTDLPFPAGSTIARMALLALVPLMEAAVPAAEGRYLVTTGQVQDVCAGLRERYQAAWGKDEVSNTERLATRVTDMLTQVGLACRADDDGVLLSPAATRWQPQTEEKKAPTESPATPGGELYLFDDEDGSYTP